MPDIDTRAIEEKLYETADWLMGNVNDDAVEVVTGRTVGAFVDDLRGIAREYHEHAEDETDNGRIFCRCGQWMRNVDEYDDPRVP